MVSGSESFNPDSGSSVSDFIEMLGQAVGVDYDSGVADMISAV